MFREALFVDRLNRFVVLCEEGGRRFPAHLPNPGRLWEILLPGRVLLLEDQGKRDMPRVWGALLGEKVVCLHTASAASVARKLLEEECLEDFAGFRVAGTEIPIGNSRLDFLLKRGREKMFLEVKSCTLFFDGLAMFPDAVTVRGRKHVELLADLGGAVLFVVHVPSPFAFLPDFHTDPEFASALYAARKKVLIRAVAVRWDTAGNFQYSHTLDLPWEVYEREAGDRGSYLLSGYLPETRRIAVGNLGELDFPQGFYVYVGSAMRGLLGRIRRHLRKRKRSHWHIDALLPFLEDVRAFPIRSSERLECAIARGLEDLARPIPRFGASDCSCGSHLFYLPQPPLKIAPFVEVLLRFRMGRVAGILQEIRGVSVHSS